MKTTWLAVIREDDCIGCTKCIQACPVDAIIGATKRMHTIIADACIGCKLCIAPCPVDCIDLQTIPLPSTEQRKQIAAQARKAVAARRARVSSASGQPAFSQTCYSNMGESPKLPAATEILAAVARVQQKKQTVIS